MSSASMSTRDALTRARRVYAKKRRARREEVKEVVFDEEARREYLTGFRKRNIAKKEARVKSAKERARAERLAARREHRQELAARAANNAKAVEGALGRTADDDADAEGEDAQDEEVEYSDTEQIALVTVVEDR